MQNNAQTEPENSNPSQEKSEKSPKNTRFSLCIFSNLEALERKQGTPPFDPDTFNWTSTEGNLEAALRSGKRTGNGLAEGLTDLKDSNLVSEDLTIDPVFLLYDRKTKEIWQFGTQAGKTDQWQTQIIHNPRNQNDHQEYDLVQIKNDNYQDINLPKGSIGTIVMVRRGDTHYIVEFENLAGTETKISKDIAGEDLEILARYPEVED